MILLLSFNKRIPFNKISNSIHGYFTQKFNKILQVKAKPIKMKCN